MNSTWAFLAPFFALVITVFLTQLCVKIAGTLRSRDYRRFENRSANEIGREFPFQTARSSAADDRLAQFVPLLNSMQQTANRAQTAYHDTVVRSAACLALGFAASAGGMLSPQDWPRIFRLQALPWQMVLNWVDAIALLSVLALFLRGSRLYRPWIAKRANTELVRQYQYLSIVFPNLFPVNEEAGLCPEWRGTDHSAPGKEHHLDFLVKEVERSWQTRKRLISGSAPNHPGLDRDAIILYARKRVVRQLGWFTDSVERLQHVAERRRTLLLALYFITAALALIQLVTFERGTTLALVRPILLLITGLSLAMTAYYTNQNMKSIAHRYKVQQREIRRWLNTVTPYLKDSDGRVPIENAGAVQTICTHIESFEELMIYELVDWINISGHDVIELA